MLRSADKTLDAFHRVCRETDVRLVASEFEFLRTKMDREGYDPVTDLWFVLYFVNESAGEQAAAPDGPITLPSRK